MKAITLALSLLIATTLNGQISTGNILINSGGETGDITGWATNGDAVASAIPTATAGRFPPHSGMYSFASSSGSNAYLSQTNLLLDRSGITDLQIDSGTLAANVSFWEISLDQGGVDDSARVILTFLDGAGSVISTNASPEVASVNELNTRPLVFTNYQGSFLVPTGTRAIVYTVNFIRHNGTQLQSQVDDCSLTISGSALTNGGPTLSIHRAVDVVWPSLMNLQYQVQWTTNAGVNWSNLGLPVSGTGTSNSICDRVREFDRKLYRVITLP